LTIIRTRAGESGLKGHLVAVPLGNLEHGEDRLYLSSATRETLKRLPKFDYR